MSPATLMRPAAFDHTPSRQPRLAASGRAYPMLVLRNYADGHAIDPGPGCYTQAVQRAAKQLVAKHLQLPEDADAAFAAARAGTLARLPP